MLAKTEPGQGKTRHIAPFWHCKGARSTVKYSTAVGATRISLSSGARATPFTTYTSEMAVSYNRRARSSFETAKGASSFGMIATSHYDGPQPTPVYTFA